MISLMSTYCPFDLLEVTDAMLTEPLETNRDPTVQAYVKDVIFPYFDIPQGVSADKNGCWTACVHISSDNINAFARNVVYRRRKCMKSAVELACYEIRREVNQANKRSDGGAAGGSAVAAAPEGKEGRVAELERELAKVRADHASKVSKMKEEHLKEMRSREDKYVNFVAKLQKSHRLEVDELKREKRSMMSVQKTFLESYVEASLDALRSTSESPEMP